MVTYNNIGVGGTTTTADYPTGIAGGDLLVLCIVNKYPANPPATPSGWALQGQASGGSGVSGPSAGQVLTTVFTKVADGTETGSLTISVPGANCLMARMINCRSDLGGSVNYNVSVATASQNVGNTVNWSSVSGGNFDVTANDLVLVFNGVNHATVTFTGYTLAETGIVFGARSQRVSVGTSAGDDVRIQVVSCNITSGTANSPVTYTMTASLSAADTPAGSTVFVRIRDGKRRVFNLC
jgi:hypothetical protein